MKPSVGGGSKGPLRDRDGPDSRLWPEDGANRLRRRQVEPTLGPILLVGEGFATLLSAQFSSDRPTALGRPVAIRPGLGSSRPPSCYSTVPTQKSHDLIAILPLCSAEHFNLRGATVV